MISYVSAHGTEESHAMLQPEGRMQHCTSCLPLALQSLLYFPWWPLCSPEIYSGTALLLLQEMEVGQPFPLVFKEAIVLSDDQATSLGSFCLDYAVKVFYVGVDRASAAS